MNGSCIDYTVKLRQQNAPQWIKMEKKQRFSSDWKGEWTCRKKEHSNLTSYLSLLVNNGNSVLQLHVVEETGEKHVGHTNQTMVLLFVEERVGSAEVWAHHLKKKTGLVIMCLFLCHCTCAVLYVHWLGYHCGSGDSPAILGTTPSCPPDGSPSSPNSRSVSLCNVVAPELLAHWAQHLSKHTNKNKKQKH